MALLDETNARESDYPASNASEPTLDLAEAAELGVIDAVSESDALFAAASTPSMDREPGGRITRPEADGANGVLPFFSSTAFLGGSAAVGWLLVAAWIALSHFGLDAIAAMGFAMQAALAAVALGPAILIWLGATAVAEAGRAGRLADELARIARDAVLPLERPEEAVKRITLHVRREIAELHGAVDGAYARLAALRGATAQHALLFEETIGDALSSADMLTQNLRRERDAFAALNGDLRLSTQTSVHAANVTAKSVREATQRAIGDAKAVADLIRQETQAMHATASAALAAMRETADAVRLSSPFSRIAGERKDPASGTRSAVAAGAQEAPRSLLDVAASIAQNQVDRMRLGGRSGWTHLLPKPANDSTPAPLSNDLVSFPPPNHEAVARHALDLVAKAGVSVGETLSERDLDAVAAASRKSLTARRNAVLDAAPVEVAQIARLLRRDSDAKEAALTFRKRSDLAQVRSTKRSRARADLMRAYLLVDAALG